MRLIGQVTEVEPTPAVSPETETVIDMIKKLLPTPAPPPLQAVLIRSDRDLLIQQLMEAICPPTSVGQERSPAGDLETLLLNWLPVVVVVCWSLTSLCHSNGHIETMPAREINPFTALTRIRSQFLRTQ